MPVFFLLAGYMGHFIYQKNPQDYLTSRFKRIAVPFVVFSLLLLPVLRVLWLAGENPSFDWQHIRTTYFDHQTGTHQRSPVNFAHLWFLMYLYLFAVTAYFGRNILARVTWAPQKTIFLFFVVSFLAQLCMPGSYLENPFIWYPRPALAIYYLSFFLTGWLLFRSNVLEKPLFTLPWPLHGILAVITLLRLLHQTQQIPIEGLPVFMLKFAATLSTWYLVYLCFRLAQNLKTPSKLVQRFADSSYLFYILHLPIVVLLQLVLHPYALPWQLKFLAINAITLVFLIGLSHTRLNTKIMTPFLKGQLPLPFFGKSSSAS
jgi:peptidoglycan/LPS O-acetylase OafA/YrhL